MELLIRRYFNSLDVEEGVDVSLLVSYANNTFTVTTYKNVEGFKEPKADAFDLKMTDTIYAYVPKDKKKSYTGVQCLEEEAQADQTNPQQINYHVTLFGKRYGVYLIPIYYHYLISLVYYLSIFIIQ